LTLTAVTNFTWAQRTNDFFAKTAIGAVYSLRWPKFRAMLDRAAHQQEDWLLERVRRCRDTKFGRDHGFAEIRSLADFRKRVPVSRYDYFAPYIQAVANGDPSAVIPDSERLIQFTLTTGSSGTPKWNPVSNVWMKQYRQAWDLWGLKLFVDHKVNLGQQMLQLAGKWDMGRTPAGHQISMVSALLARAQNPMMKPYYATPSDVNDIPDPVARYYTALRLSITQRVGWIVLMNPGTLIRMAEIGDQFREDLLHDLRDGTLTNRFEVPGEVRRALASRIQKRHPRKVAELEEVIRRTGTLYPKDYWPPLVIGCWLGGTAGHQKTSLPRYFGDVPMRDMGLVSSEGRHTIPIEDHKPEGVPSIVSGFYEFVPVDEVDSPTPTVLNGHELEPGRDYYLLMTTAGAFYRFNIGDIVRCTGFVGQAPLVDFLQKGDRVGDLEGEKLTEHQFLECSHSAAAALGIALSEVTAAPFRDETGRPRYLILAEESDFCDHAKAKQFIEELDRRLMAINFLVNYRRREGVLDAPRLLLIESGSWRRYMQQESDRRGTGDYQFKHPGLVHNADWTKQFKVTGQMESEVLSAGPGEKPQSTSLP
jgi:hypothetical protein